MLSFSFFIWNFSAFERFFVQVLSMKLKFLSSVGFLILIISHDLKTSGKCANVFVTFT